MPLNCVIRQTLRRPDASPNAAAVRRRSVALWIVAIGTLTLGVLAHPKPAAVPYRWELIFEPGDLRLYVDPVDQRPYWYLTYKVTNRSGQDLLWAPRFTLFLDSGDILESGGEVPFRVTQDLLDMLANEFLEDQNRIIGDIRQGRENAKEGLVIWPATTLRVNELSLFVAGISGETARVRNPASGEEVVLRKTLQRDYLIRGNIRPTNPLPIEPVQDTWIMR